MAEKARAQGGEGGPWWSTGGKGKEARGVEKGMSRAGDQNTEEPAPSYHGDPMTRHRG